MMALPVGLAGQRLSPPDSVAAAVLSDLFAAPGWISWGGTARIVCLDPFVTTFPSPPPGPAVRWPTAVLSTLATRRFVAVDSSTGVRQTGAPPCERSREVARLSFGRPTIDGDHGQVPFVATRLDARGNVDSMSYLFRLDRKPTGWYVSGWDGTRDRINAYARGDGCYRMNWPQEDGAFPIARDLIRAEPTAAGDYYGQQVYRLTPGPIEIGLGGSHDATAGMWYVTHDTLHLAWFAVFSAIMVDLEVRGDSLVGVQWVETDAHDPANPPRRFAVTGRRVECSS